MHLGRRPSRLPDELREPGLEPDRLGPAAAWRRAVERARELEVDAVLLAGDLVESANELFEAYGVLRAGVDALVAAGIDVCAVAGNHDVTVLPRLAGELPGFTLLGAGGEWGTHLIARGGAPLARVLGWSFPTRRVEASPLASLPADLRAGRYDDGAPDELPTVGLLHCDLDAGGGAYAPVAAAELPATVSAWFLGHVHAPSLADGSRPAGYLGSLVGLDPGEPGPRGPWLATRAGGAWELEHLPLAPLRWERVAVDATGLADADALGDALLRSLEARHRELAPGLGEARAVGCRLVLRGASALPDAARAAALAGARELRPVFRNDPLDVQWFVESARDETVPAVDLERLARGDDPLAILAGRVLALERGDGAEWIAEARARMEPQAAHPSFHPLEAGPLEDAEVREVLLDAARTALHGLLAQRPGAAAAAVPAAGAEGGA